MSATHDPGAFNLLRRWARMLHDAQKGRIALDNRAAPRCIACGKRSVTCACSPKGETYYPVDPDAYLLAIVGLKQTEHAFELAMRRAFRKASPELAAWQKETTGIGETLLARYLGEVGHPRIALPHHWEGEGDDRVLIADEPRLRSPSQLWSFSGHGDPARKPYKGMGADEMFALGRPQAKMLLHLIAEGAIKEPGRSIATLLGRTICETSPGADASDPADSAEGTADDASPKTAASPRPQRSGRTIDLTTPIREASDPTPSPDAAANQGTTPTSRAPGIRNPSTAGGQVVHGPHTSDARQPWPYREVYEKWRWRYLERTDDDGKPWSDGHQHNAALHNTAKAIALDIWRAAGEPT